MKTAGMSDAVLPLTKKQKAISNVVMGVLFLAAGVIIVLASVGVIPGGAVVAAPTVLFAFGLSVLFSAVVAKNALSMWFAGVVLACGATSLVEMVSPATYGNLFPIYIAAPGVGCVFAIVFAEAKMPQIKGIVFFGVLAGIFSLASSGLCGWGLTGGLLAAFAGVAVLFFAVEGYLRRDKTEDA
ncbi:MAG: hypothetical protein OSJ83_06465 [Clostridia bacterium]|nr:hypothetical protein [Clostridia bacterium]